MLPSRLGFAVDYLERGNFYAEQEKYKLAISDYDRAIKIDADYADAYYNRGYSYVK